MQCSARIRATLMQVLDVKELEDDELYVALRMEIQLLRQVHGI